MIVSLGNIVGQPQLPLIGSQLYWAMPMKYYKSGQSSFVFLIFNYFKITHPYISIYST